jgi:hypothetical protein
MTADNLARYRAAQRAQLSALRGRLSVASPAAAAALHVLDIAALTAACGPECTADGIHHDATLYCVVAQQALNIVTRGNDGVAALACDAY